MKSYYHSHTLPLGPLSPIALYNEMSHDQTHAFIYESGEYHTEKGRYSFIGAQASQLLEVPALDKRNAFEELKNALTVLTQEADDGSQFPHAPSFFGFFSFETARHTEHLTLPYTQGVVPDALFFVPHMLVVIDHVGKTVTALATSQEKLLLLQKILSQAETKTPTQLRAINTSFSPEALPLTTQQNFATMFYSAREHIASGDLMQLVVSQKLELPAARSDFEMYQMLREEFPAPYMYLMKFPELSIIGSSPETLVKRHKNTVIVRPIAGTRPRGATTHADELLERELNEDSKENAEHAMLVDLGRNDLGKICVPGTVVVTKSRHIEKMSTVMHLVSEVQGELLPDTSSVDAFVACFPAGTLVGAPKRRALERIIELEKAPRGIYGGAVGYIDCTGKMDFAIGIRTLVHTGSRVRLQAGAGIVADSTAAFEDRECRIKMKAQYITATY